MSLTSSLAGLNFALSLMGLLVSGSVLFSFLIHHRGHWNIQEKLGPFILVLFTFLWPLFMGFSYITVVVHGSFTPFWCQYFGVVVIWAVGGALTGHILLALERYYKVLHNEKLTTAKSVTCFCVINGYLTITLIIQLGFAPYGFIPMESGTWCYIDFTSSHPIQRANNILSLLYCLGSMNSVMFAYFSVYYKTREVVHVQSIRNSTERRRDMQSTGQYRTMSPLEKRVFYRCVLITASFVTFFTPTFIGVFYRFFSGKWISAEIDFFTSAFAWLDCMFTPILVCYMQPDFREAVLAYLPKKWRMALEAYFEKEASLVRSSGPKASVIHASPSPSVDTRSAVGESITTSNPV